MSASNHSKSNVSKDGDVHQVVGDEELDNGRIFDAREAKRQIGIPTAIFLIVNRIIGTGIFATPLRTSLAGLDEVLGMLLPLHQRHY